MEAGRDRKSQLLKAISAPVSSSRLVATLDEICSPKMKVAPATGGTGPQEPTCTPAEMNRLSRSNNGHAHPDIRTRESVPVCQ